MGRVSEVVQGMNLMREIRVSEDHVGVSSAFLRLQLPMMVSKCGEGLKDGSRSKSCQRSEVLKIRLGFLRIFPTFSTSNGGFKM